LVSFFVLELSRDTIHAFGGTLIKHELANLAINARGRIGIRTIWIFTWTILTLGAILTTVAKRTTATSSTFCTTLIFRQPTSGTSYARGISPFITVKSICSAKFTDGGTFYIAVFTSTALGTRSLSWVTLAEPNGAVGTGSGDHVANTRTIRLVALGTVLARVALLTPDTIRSSFATTTLGTFGIRIKTRGASRTRRIILKCS
jgi:hypothetical protein